MTLVHGLGHRDLLGRPLDELPDTMPRITFRQEGATDAMTTKAPHDGIYTLGGNRFRIQAGHPLPDGAVMDAAGPEPAAKPEERAKGRAPQNKSKGAAPENRSE